MSDFSTLQIIEQIVLQKAQNHEMFTAHDVTRTVRSQVGRGTNIPHNDVKQEVHNMFLNGRIGTDYTRTLGSLPIQQQNPQPWIYHHVSDDPSTYSITPAVASAQIVYTSKDDSEDDDHDDGVNLLTDGSYKVDARETLCVPATMLRSLGMNPGDTTYVSVDFGGNQYKAAAIVISKDAPQSNCLSAYTVDSYGNVRITQATLKKGGLGGNQYKIEADGDKIFVTLV